MGDIWCYLTLICPYFVEGTGRNRLDDIMWTKGFCDFLQKKIVMRIWSIGESKWKRQDGNIMYQGCI